MKNKENLKKYLVIMIAVFGVFVIILLASNIIQYNKFNQNNNIVINQIINNIKQNYPEADINEIIQILNSENLDKKDWLEEYGINIDTDTAMVQNQNEYQKFMIFNIAILLLLGLAIIIIFINYNKSQNKKIAEITKYIEKINNGNYSLNIQDNSEDELSILKNELYKITVMLKEQSENSLKDKLQLKKSLEDISHQLKTPLTSITIMLDNLLDNPNMDENTRNDFLRSINREISNINFFIQALLKLSKFDANTIKFNRKEEKIKEILKEAKQNVAMLCDLKNIEVKIEVENDKEPTIICDFKWQVEAITNILKNSVEHSEENSNIYILCSENTMYTEIKIKDNGAGIDKKDLKHIFERFYKGKNSSKDSIGIGLPLAKTIIEKDNGYITINSKIGQGTEFTIRYLKT